ncbi:hypothetical protein ACUH92_08940 [Dermabacteraceae bacterium CCM 9520]
MAREIVWTPKRVETLLKVRAFNCVAVPGSEDWASGYVDNRANLAATLGVSPSSVSRWLRRKNAHRGAPAAIPESRLREFLAECRPSDADYVREADWKRNSRSALDRLYFRRLVPFPRWKQLHWLDPHRVYMVDLKSIAGLSRIGVVRVGIKREKPFSQLASSIVVRNRFEAELVKLSVLADVDSARLVVGSGKGKTHTWITDVRVPNLELVRDRVLKEL